MTTDLILASACGAMKWQCGAYWTCCGIRNPIARTPSVMRLRVMRVLGMSPAWSLWLSVFVSLCSCITWPRGIREIHQNLPKCALTQTILMVHHRHPHQQLHKFCGNLKCYQLRKFFIKNYLNMGMFLKYYSWGLIISIGGVLSLTI